MYNINSIEFYPTKEEIKIILSKFDNKDFYSIYKMIRYTGEKKEEFKEFLKSINIDYR